jgi:hypothetical protein
MRSPWWPPWTSRRSPRTCGRTGRSARRTGRGARGKRRATKTTPKQPPPPRRRRRSGRPRRRARLAEVLAEQRRLGHFEASEEIGALVGWSGTPPTVPGTEERGAAPKGAGRGGGAPREPRPAPRGGRRDWTGGAARPSPFEAGTVPEAKRRRVDGDGDGDGTGTSRDVPGRKRARVGSGTRGGAAEATRAGSGTTASWGRERARPGRTPARGRSRRDIRRGRHRGRRRRCAFRKRRRTRPRGRPLRGGRPRGRRGREVRAAAAVPPPRARALRRRRFVRLRARRGGAPRR